MLVVEFFHNFLLYVVLELIILNHIVMNVLAAVIIFPPVYIYTYTTVAAL